MGDGASRRQRGEPPRQERAELPCRDPRAPFFDPRASNAANYGGIGVTIGHEISHSFDDQGAKFDAQGRYANWWTPEDLARFQASGAALAAQFSAYKPFPDVSVNGKQTLSENIADLAGTAVAYDAWRASLGGKEAPVVDGLTGDQQFFLACAQGWRSKERDELLRMQLATDGHAPAHYRALTVRNLDAVVPGIRNQRGGPALSQTGGPRSRVVTSGNAFKLTRAAPGGWSGRTRVNTNLRDCTSFSQEGVMNAPRPKQNGDHLTIQKSLLRSPEGADPEGNGLSSKSRRIRPVAKPRMTSVPPTGDDEVDRWLR